MALELTSPAFRDGEMIPVQYTGDGRDASPPLSWNDTPPGTRSLAVVCEDPDAPRGTFTHWVVFNLPAETRQLDEGFAGGETLPAGAAQGKNGFGKLGYGGPAPPPGKPHRYIFKLFALDEPLGLRPGASRDELLAAMSGHVVAQAQLTGKYGRGE